MSSQADSGLSGVVGTIVGIGLLYWFSVIAAGVMLLAIASIVLGLVLVPVALYGAFSYIMKARQAVSSGDNKVAFSLIISPMLAPVGVVVGLFLTEVVNVRTFTDFIGYYEGTPGKEFLVALIGFIYAMWLWLGWIIAIIFSYTDTKGEARFFASLLWASWGFGWAMALGWNHFVDMTKILFG